MSTHYKWSDERYQSKAPSVKNNALRYNRCTTFTLKYTYTPCTWVTIAANWKCQKSRINNHLPVITNRNGNKTQANWELLSFATPLLCWPILKLNTCINTRKNNTPNCTQFLKYIRKMDFKLFLFLSLFQCWLRCHCLFSYLHLIRIHFSHSDRVMDFQAIKWNKKKLKENSNKWDYGEYFPFAVTIRKQKNQIQEKCAP